MTTIQEALTNLVEAKLAAGYSEKTIEQYGYAVGKLAAHVGSKSIEELQARDIRGMLANLRRSGAAAATLESVYRSIHAFFAWTVAEYQLDHDPMATVEKPRLPNILPGYLPDESITALLNAAARSRNAARDVALVSFLLDTGLRSSELTHLKRADVDIVQRRVLVLGKGNKERLIPFSAELLPKLAKYWNGRHDILPWAFRSARSVDGKLTKSGLKGLIHRLALSAGIERRVYPHLLRHTFACRWVRAGGDIETLRRILGHTSLVVTLRYLGLAVDDLQAKHDQLRLGELYRG